MKAKMGWSLLAVCLAVLVMVGGVSANDAATDQAAANEAIPGTARADKLDSCVAATPFMRRNHFELIKHQRDITVHEGIRDTDNSLAGCVACHVRHDKLGEPVAINAPGEFCAGCHAYTGATLDCFTCHATKPMGTEQ